MLVRSLTTLVTTTLNAVEVDGAWGGLDRNWNLTEADRFAWFAREQGYDVFFKAAYTTSGKCYEVTGLFTTSR